MSIAAVQAHAFFHEVITKNEVWAIRDDNGFPTSTNVSGQIAMPFWSLESRAKTMVKNVLAYRDFRTERLTLVTFVQNWLPGLEKDGLFVGINWSGRRATGYDMRPRDVLSRLETTEVNGR